MLQVVEVRFSGLWIARRKLDKEKEDGRKRYWFVYRGGRLGVNGRWIREDRKCAAYRKRYGVEAYPDDLALFSWSHIAAQMGHCHKKHQADADTTEAGRNVEFQMLEGNVADNWLLGIFGVDSLFGQRTSRIEETHGSQVVESVERGTV